MKQALKARARALGFDDCRVTAAIPPEHAAQFKQWLAKREHGELGYLERTAAKRVDPQQVLTGARSIITLAVSYAGERRVSGVECDPETRRVDDRPRATPNPQRSGVVARYARYRDYHEVLGERLTQLTQFVNQLGGEGARSLWYVDTGPLLERDFAQRAGLGFIGKPPPWQLGFPGRDNHHPRASARPAGDKPLRHLHAVHCGLPDRCDQSAFPT